MDRFIYFLLEAIGDQQFSFLWDYYVFVYSFAIYKPYQVLINFIPKITIHLLTNFVVRWI
jgi:hypothetical protein